MIVTYLSPSWAKTFEYDLWGLIGALAEYVMHPIDPFPAEFEAQPWMSPNDGPFILWAGLYPCRAACEGCAECGWTQLGGTTTAPPEYVKAYYRQKRALVETP